MRRVFREELDRSTAAELTRRQKEADLRNAQGQLDVSGAWRSMRESVHFRPALAALKRMAGQAERCMYCLDSHGTDVEHFWPKSPYPQRMFVWANLLLGCTECGRLKGDRFPMSRGGPLLVDPSTEDPWEHIDFDCDTGNLMPRCEANGEISPKGEATVNLLQLDQREALSRVYRRTFNRLSGIVTLAMNGPPPAAEELLRQLEAQDDHGLLAWCFSERGARNANFGRLRQEFPEIWTAGVARFNASAVQP
jgi:uncharacterized protein (TIGR02646 family)